MRSSRVYNLASFQQLAISIEHPSCVKLMSILVTGGAGYIGSHMVFELLDAGEQVIVLDNLSTGFRQAVPEGVPLIVGDTGDQPLVTRLIHEYAVKAIVHFAASLIIPDSVRDPLAYYKNNTVNSRALIDCAVIGGRRAYGQDCRVQFDARPERIPCDASLCWGARQIGCQAAVPSLRTTPD
jgi:UDP-glucose 4-epimerase